MRDKIPEGCALWGNTCQDFVIVENKPQFSIENQIDCVSSANDALHCKSYSNGHIQKLKDAQQKRLADAQAVADAAAEGARAQLENET